MEGIPVSTMAVGVRLFLLCTAGLELVEADKSGWLVQGTMPVRNDWH